MTLRIRTITFDCADPYLLVAFWSQVTGYREDPENPNFPDDPEGLLVAPDGSASLLFIKVPEGKTTKNRVHLDLAPPAVSPDAPVEDHRRPDRTGWVVLADPEGNEFCIERGISGG